MFRKIALFFTALLFLPLGFMVVKSSFYLNSPHFFVMSIFSGSLMILLGLTGIVGLVVKLEPEPNESKKPKE
jgi:putative effector of murein hydrolase LrgA (UPF0299 family)